jgi:hypothetical protein
MTTGLHFPLSMYDSALSSWYASDTGILALCVVTVLALGVCSFSLIKLWHKRHPIIVLGAPSLPEAAEIIEADDDDLDIPRAA